ncbi:hypothetical protein KAI78_01045 [bacterium]|nr:hypothetical protein [bacterium]
MKKILLSLAIVILISGTVFAAGPKMRVAVSSFEDKTNSYGHWEIGSGISDMLITELVQTEKYSVMERSQLNKILEEQKLSLSGAITGQTSAQAGKLLGVQYLITGSVTEFINRSSSGGSGVRVKGIRIGGKAFYAKVGIDIRVYDVNTGEIIAAQHAVGESKGMGFDLGASSRGIDFRTSKMQKSPLGKAVRQAIQQAVYFITQKVANKAWEGKTMKVSSDGMVYINGGSNYGIEMDTVFQVEAIGEELIDPDTGLSLGSENEFKGTIRVVDVKEKYAICEVLTGSGFDKGQIVKAVDE